jgi:hypothetical protein
MRLLRAPVREDVTDLEAETLRQARLKVARTNPRWVELEAVDLVRRGPGWLVSAETDAIFTPYRGVVFVTGATTVIADQSACSSPTRDDSPSSSEAPARRGRITSLAERSVRVEGGSSATVER